MYTALIKGTACPFLHRSSKYHSVVISQAWTICLLLKIWDLQILSKIVGVYVVLLRTDLGFGSGFFFFPAY